MSEYIPPIGTTQAFHGPSDMLRTRVDNGWIYHTGHLDTVSGDYITTSCCFVPDSVQALHGGVREELT